MQLLQSRTLWSGAALATALDVDPRVLRRDIDRLRTLGHRIESSRGTGGGYRLQPSASIPAFDLTVPELIATVSGLQVFSSQGMHGMDVHAQQALQKIRKHLPSRKRFVVEDISEHFDVRTVHETELEPTTFSHVLKATRERRRIYFDYRKADGTQSFRRAEPHRILVVDLRWYIQSFDLERDARRTFCFDQISNIHLMTFRFTERDIPDPFSRVDKK